MWSGIITIIPQHNEMNISKIHFCYLVGFKFPTLNNGDLFSIEVPAFEYICVILALAYILYNYGI